MKHSYVRHFSNKNTKKPRLLDVLMCFGVQFHELAHQSKRASSTAPSFEMKVPEIRLRVVHSLFILEYLLLHFISICIYLLCNNASILKYTHCDFVWVLYTGYGRWP